LTERIRRRPYAVVLLDEIEKAIGRVQYAAAVMEEGRLTDNVGRMVDFKNTILVMTSNIGAELIKSGGVSGFGLRPKGEDNSFENMKKNCCARSRNTSGRSSSTAWMTRSSSGSSPRITSIRSSTSR